MMSRTVVEAADRNEPKWDCPTCGVTHVGARAQAALSSTPRPASEVVALRHANAMLVEELGRLLATPRPASEPPAATDRLADAYAREIEEHESRGEKAVDGKWVTPPAARPEGGA
jgi:hypothetical protein